MQEKEIFPLYIDRFPIQLLSFLRFSRIQDTAQFARASFEKDVVVSQMNEYETLQLVMGELRDRFQAYIDGQVRPACGLPCEPCMKRTAGVSAVVAQCCVAIAERARLLLYAVLSVCICHSF